MIPLIPATLVALAGAYLSYAGGSIWWIITMGVGNAVLWGWATQVSKSPEDLFVVSCAWDLMLVVTYTVLPLLAGLVQLSPAQVSGVALMVLGFLMVKYT